MLVDDRKLMSAEWLQDIFSCTRVKSEYKNGHFTEIRFQKTMKQTVKYELFFTSKI